MTIRKIVRDNLNIVIDDIVNKVAGEGEGEEHNYHYFNVMAIEKMHNELCHDSKKVEIASAI